MTPEKNKYVPIQDDAKVVKSMLECDLKSLDIITLKNCPENCKSVDNFFRDYNVLFSKIPTLIVIAPYKDIFKRDIPNNENNLYIAANNVFLERK